MTRLVWDEVGERFYETGVDYGVLYFPDGSGIYTDGVAWNGLTTVTESPSGAEASPQWADNIKYLNLISVEEFGGTIEAFTYPPEFGQADGTAEPSPGIAIGQQARKLFGLCYRTRFGNDQDGNDHGYKLHLVYGAQASPSEKAYATVNDSPEAIAFSWDFTTIPVPVTGLKPTSLIVINSTLVDPTELATLEDILYGDADSDAELPSPDQIIAMFGAGITVVDMGTFANQPSYDAGTHVITLPAVAGVQWTINGDDVASGAQPPLSVGETAVVEATPADGTHRLEGDTDWTYDY